MLVSLRETSRLVSLSDNEPASRVQNEDVEDGAGSMDEAEEEEEAAAMRRFVGNLSTAKQVCLQGLVPCKTSAQLRAAADSWVRRSQPPCTVCDKQRSAPECALSSK